MNFVLFGASVNLDRCEIGSNWELEMSEASDFEKLKKKFEKLSSKYGELKPRMKSSEKNAIKNRWLHYINATICDIDGKMQIFSPVIF